MKTNCYYQKRKVSSFKVKAFLFIYYLLNCVQLHGKYKNNSVESRRENNCLQQ